MRIRIQISAWAAMYLGSSCALAVAVEKTGVEVGVEGAVLTPYVKVNSASATKSDQGARNLAAQNGSADPAGSMLYLKDGDYFAGRLRDCPTANPLRWQASGATQPFEFAAETVRSAYFAPPSKRPAPEGEYRLELS